MADVTMIPRINTIEDEWGQGVTWQEQEIILDNPTCTTTCRLICDTAREDRLYRWQLYDGGTDPYDDNIRGWLGGVIADLAVILMRRNGPLKQVANVSDSKNKNDQRQVRMTFSWYIKY